MAWAGVSGGEGKWRQLYTNNNKKLFFKFGFWRLFIFLLSYLVALVIYGTSYMVSLPGQVK